MENPDKYGWEPKTLLSQLIDIYLHLDCDSFAEALAADEVNFSFILCILFLKYNFLQRSFSKQLFSDATALIERIGIKNAGEVKQFWELSEKALRVLERNQRWVNLLVDLNFY